jgi:hypothetical protein
LTVYIYERIQGDEIVDEKDVVRLHDLKGHVSDVLLVAGGQLTMVQDMTNAQKEAMG